MQIVHIMTRLLRGGAEENTLITADAQVRAGHDVVFLYGRGSLPEFVAERAPGVRTIAIPSLVWQISPWNDFRAFLQLRRVLRSLNPDIVHTHQSKAGILGRFAAASIGVPLIVHGVHILPFLGETGIKHHVYLAAERWAGKLTDGFIHVSEGMRAACAANGVGRDARHFVVRSGFDLQRFRNAVPPDDSEELLGSAGAEADRVVVGMLASLEHRKQILEFVELLPSVIEACPGVQVVLAGEGQLRGEVEQRLADLGITDHVHLLGYRTDPEAIIAMSDVCVLSSLREGLPRSVLQYLAVGRPILMFDLPGLEEIITDRVNAIVVSGEDWGRYTSELIELCRDAELRQRLATAARATPLAAWDADLLGQQTMEACNELLAATDRNTLKPVPR